MAPNAHTVRTPHLKEVHGVGRRSQKEDTLVHDSQVSTPWMGNVHGSREPIYLRLT